MKLWSQNRVKVSTRSGAVGADNVDDPLLVHLGHLQTRHPALLLTRYLDKKLVRDDIELE